MSFSHDYQKLTRLPSCIVIHNLASQQKEQTMQIAILTFDGFNELDSLIPYGIINRMRGWKCYITAPTKTITSLNGLIINAEKPLEFSKEADAVIIGSGNKTLAICQNESILSRIILNPNRQIIATQCSGALILGKLGLLANLPACTDIYTKPELEAAGIQTLNQPFYATGNIASAGGCLASQYLTTWLLLKLGGIEAARYCMDYVAPVGEQEAYVERLLSVVAYNMI